MMDSRLARPWADVCPQMDAGGVSCELRETRSPRNFFAVDETTPYIVRVTKSSGIDTVTLTYAPARSASVTVYEEKFS